MSTAVEALSTDARRKALTKALKRYDGYAVVLTPDGLGASLTRKKKIGWVKPLILVLLAVTVIGLFFIPLVLGMLNRKIESVTLYVDERGKIIKS